MLRLSGYAWRSHARVKVANMLVLRSPKGEVRCVLRSLKDESGLITGIQLYREHIFNVAQATCPA